MRYCHKCQEETGRDDKGRCKPCANKRAAKWRAANPDRYLDAISAWHAANPDVKRLSDAKYRAANREKINAGIAKISASNPEARRIITQNYRARKREDGGRLSKDIAERLFALQRGKCACGCGQPLGDDYHRDHRMPIALGGTNTDDNIQLLTATCNLQKGAKHPVDFMQQRGFLI